MSQSLTTTQSRRFRSPLALAITGLVLAMSGITAADARRLPAPASDADFRVYDNQDARFELGRFLFFDKVISGNQNNSCATCHHPLAGTSDGLSLPVGEGGVGLSVTRETGSGADAIVERVPRNAPQLFNLGASEFTIMFHDGRLRDLGDGTMQTPAGVQTGIDSALAGQAQFPVTSPAEMAGQAGENSVADATAVGNLDGPGGVWEQLAQRLQAIPEYVDLFKDAFPSEISQASDITFKHAANAIGTFEDVNWRSINTPFDRFLRGDRRALSVEQRIGMRLFYGRAGCSTCHSGTYLTDQQFHAIAMPQIGPGKGDPGPGGDNHGDLGLGRESGDPADNYKFRTPPLRNIALTAPYGHDGAYNSLEAVIRHHLDPVNSLENYDTSEAVLPTSATLDGQDFVHHSNADNRAAIAAANELAPRNLRDRDVDYLLAFMQALTDPSAVDLRSDVPDSVPSGLSLVE